VTHILIALQLVLTGAADAKGQQPNDEASNPAGHPSVTVNRTASPPKVDGRLDDLVWKDAARITDFVQQRPLEGAPATEQTEVRIAFDDQNIYFAIYAHYSDPGLIRANRVDRDQIGRDDTVSVFFDPFLDQQRAYVFSVNGYGVQGDAVATSGGGPGGGGPGGGPGGGGGGSGGGGGGGGRPRGGMGNMPPSGGPGMREDTSWDALFFTSGHLVEDGWVAEMTIPFKSLRYPARGPGEAHRWGFQIQRDIESKNESIVWSPVSRNVMSFLGQMGTLTGLRNLSKSRNLELLPTFTAIDAGALNTTTGVYNHIDTNAEAGLNVKYGVTSNLTADFTANPDFSQIEADAAQIEVNQRFPLFYPERRPFFLEGQEIFDITGPITLIHTRTIVDPAFGAKVTGKVGRTTLGLLVANDVAPGKVDDPSDRAFGQSATVFIGRLRYDIFSESYVGVIATDREFLDSYSRLGGFDSQLRFGPNHRLSMKFIAADRNDATNGRRTGVFADASFRKEGRNLSYGISHWRIPPEFGTALGFIRRADTQQTNTNFGYRWWPQSWVINWGPRLNYSRNYDYRGVQTDEDLGVNVMAQLRKNINIFNSTSRIFERYRDVDFHYNRVSLGGSINTSRKFSIGGFMNVGDQIRYIENPFLGQGRNFSTFVSVRPISRVQSQIDITTSRLVDPATQSEVFNVKIYRALSTYQFTDRLTARNITEFNSYTKTLALNLLATYRVNSGTVFYVGYDDNYRQGPKIDPIVFPNARYERTNRAIFTKLQYLFRY
jgi:hypothetical protein